MRSTPIQYTSVAINQVGGVMGQPTHTLILNGINLSRKWKLVYPPSARPPTSAPDPRGVFEGAAEHLRGGARPPRRALPRREVPARRSSPAASPADPRAARTGPRGAGRGVEEGVRARDASPAS